MNGEDGLRRVLGPFSATCVVVGAIIGVGIFFTPARVAAVTQDPGLALGAWIIGGVVALLGALTFAELGGMYQGSGAQYSALRDAWGSFPAFLYGFCLLTAIQAGAIAIIALVFAEHVLLAVTGRPPDPGSLLPPALLVIAGLAVANAAGVRSGAALQNVTTVLKVATLAAVGLVALLADVEAAPAAQAPRPSGLCVVGLMAAALPPVLFSFGGWQQMLWVGGEVRDARRNVPLALVAGVLIVVAVYLIANAAFLHLLGVGRVADSSTVAADAIAVVAPGSGVRIVAGAVALSAFGVLNAQLLTGPRVTYTMARDGRFFRPFGRVHPRTATPLAAIVLLATLAAALLVFAGQDPVEMLLNGVVFIDQVFFGLTALSVIILRRRRPDLPRPVRVLGYPVVPGLFALGTFGAVAGTFLDPALRTAAVVGACWIAAGTLLYLACFRGSRP